MLIDFPCNSDIVSNDIMCSGRKSPVDLASKKGNLMASKNITQCMVYVEFSNYGIVGLKYTRYLTIRIFNLMSRSTSNKQGTNLCIRYGTPWQS